MEKYTAEQIRGFCQNNGVNCTPVGTELRVMDISQVPASMRAFLNEDGTYKGEDTSVETATFQPEPSGEPNANPDAVRKMPTDDLEDVERREAQIQTDTKKAAKKASKKR